MLCFHTHVFPSREKPRKRELPPTVASLKLRFGTRGKDPQPQSTSIEPGLRSLMRAQNFPWPLALPIAFDSFKTGLIHAGLLKT